MKPTKSMGILSLSDIANDPRVRRQGDALHQAGWSVFGVGLPGRPAPQPAWKIFTEPELSYDAEPQVPSSGARLAGMIRRVRSRFKRVPLARKLWSVVRAAKRLADLLVIWWRPEHAQRLYWTWPEPLQLYRACQGRTADIWLANDWITLPLAARLARECGGVYVYDTHELALHEYSERLQWRLFKRPVIAAIERAGIQGARHVSAVSNGIAATLKAEYGLAQLPTVIRNMPSYQEATFQPVGSSIKVLYHGILVPNRGLEEAIESVRSWRSDLCLTLRGPGNAAYLDALRARADALGVGDRVIFAAPVAMTDLVSEARRFDVGFFALPGHSRHNRYALPNKFFEYVMAGLALCVSDLPEMSALLKEHDLGVVIPDTCPDTIAATVNALTPASIEGYKRNALRAAQELNWDCESRKLISAYDALVDDVRRMEV